MQDIQKKLKIVGKTKIEKFEEQMNVFKDTETYIEIKPFLESLNVANHRKYIETINKYQHNIDVAKQHFAHEDFVKNAMPAVHQSEIDFELAVSTASGTLSSFAYLQTMKKF